MARREEPTEWTENTASEVSGAVQMLLEYLQWNGRRGWIQFRRSRGQAEYNTVFFASPAFDDLSTGDRSLPVGTLHLSQRAVTPLQAGAICTVGQLVDSARQGIVRLALGGKAVTAEITAALDAVSEVVRPNGRVDWIAYARYRSFHILPGIGAEVPIQEMILRASGVWQHAVLSRFGSKGGIVLGETLLRRVEQRAAVAKIAEQLGCTCQYLRVLQDRIVSTLSRAIFAEDYVGCRFRFEDEFVRTFHTLADGLRGRYLSGILANDWEHALRTFWNVSRSQISTQESLLLRLLGFHLLRRGTSSAVFATAPEWKRVRAAATETKRLLRQRTFSWMAKAEVNTHLSRVGLLPSGACVTSILALIPEVEEDEKGGFVRLGKKHLSCADRCESVLRSRGEPMHFRDLASHLSHAQLSGEPKKFAHSVVQALSESPRFAAVGRTGFWALRDWHHAETRTIPNIAADLLTRGPLTTDELFTSIARRRAARRGSVESLLRKDSRFIKPTSTSWALAGWVP